MASLTFLAVSFADLPVDVRASLALMIPAVAFLVCPIDLPKRVEINEAM